MLEVSEFWTKQVFFRKNTTKTHMSNPELFSNLYMGFFLCRTLQFWAQMMFFNKWNLYFFLSHTKETKDPKEIVINYPGNRHLPCAGWFWSIFQQDFPGIICMGPAWAGPVCPVWVMKWAENPKNWHSGQAGASMQLHQHSLNSLPSAGIFSCCPSFGFFLVPSSKPGEIP